MRQLDSTSLARRGAAVLVAVLACACASGSRGPAPDFALPALDGRPVRLSSLRGRVVLVLFWTSWSRPSRGALMSLSELRGRFSPRGFEVLAVSVDGPESLGQVSTAAADMGLPFPVLIDADTRVEALYNPRAGVPFVVLVGRDGRLVVKREGFLPGDERVIEDEVVKELAR